MDDSIRLSSVSRFINRYAPLLAVMLLSRPVAAIIIYIFM